MGNDEDSIFPPAPFDTCDPKTSWGIYCCEDWMPHSEQCWRWCNCTCRYDRDERRWYSHIVPYCRGYC